MSNSLLGDWTGPFELPPFAAIRDEEFAPAFEAALTQGRAAIAAIADRAEAPSFANTIEALEQADQALEKVAGVFYNLAGADSNPDREALSRDLAPKLSAYASEMTSNTALFARIEALWEQREDLGLTPEQARVLMLYRRMFVRAGAALDKAESDRMAAVKSRLASLGTQFTQNLLADERDWFMPLDDLAGLPEFVVDTAASAAKERGLDGHVVTLNRSLIVPFLQYSTRRDLREKAYEAWGARGANGGETDNRALAAETLALRHERAALLGYENFAAYKLETEMARAPQAVRDLLMRVWQPARGKALADAEAMEALREGIRGLGRAMAEDQRQNRGQNGQAAGNPQGNQRDPLGRRSGAQGQVTGSEENILQGEDVYRRAQDLLDQIRRRSGETVRPEVELDYLKRLLERY